MELIMEYIKPELIVVAVVLYFIGMWIKQSELIKDNYIPLINGIIGILISAAYVMITCNLGTVNAIAAAVFTSITQGILAAGLSTYVHQIIKQNKKAESLEGRR